MNVSAENLGKLGVDEVAQNAKASKNAYMANCPSHDWQGMYRDSYNEAFLDLQAHIGYFPDESHSGSGITQK